MRKSLLVLALVAVPVHAQTVAPDPGTTYRVVVDQKLSAAQHLLLHGRYGGGCGSHQSGPLELYLSPAEYREVQRLGIAMKVLGRGRPYAEVAKENSVLQFVPDTNYYTPAEVLAEIDRYASRYPGIARRVDITAMTQTPKTHEGRSLYALKISDNVATDEDEPAIVVASQHHARELNSPVITFGVIDRLLSGYSSNAALRNLINGHEIYCVPCVNPDGVNWVWTRDQWWRKNRRGGYGVDLNRNYPFLWGRCGASSRTSSSIYKGPSAGSEPETVTMMALHRMLRPEQYHDFHSYGREVLFTYAPCANVSTSIRSLLDYYIGNLRSPMSYATRNPSASGEAPEWVWADGGAMSFLTEISTSFQPPFSTALAEAARVWPGMQRAMTTWRPAVRGHVRSIYKDEPIAATITFAPNVFNHGEKGASRARDGRYGLWLPLGSHTVTFSAPGFRSVTRTVRVTSYNSPTTIDVRMIPNMPAATISKSGPERIGQTTSLTYRSTGDVGETYWVLLSLRATPGIPVGAGRVVPLTYDAAMRASMPPSILVNNTGALPGSGSATVGFPIPPINEFVGLRVYAAGITVNPEYLTFVKNFSQAIAIDITR